MISILSLLVLATLQSMHLYIKTSAANVSHHKVIYNLETAALKLISEPLFASHCVVDEKNPNRLNQLLIGGKGCNYKNNEQFFSYLIADLGEYPCLQIAASNRIEGSHHWWISVIAEHGDLLQLRVAKSTLGSTCKSQQPHYIDQGVLSWRYLPPLPGTV